MTRRIATGIDIGTRHVKVVVIEEVADKSGRILRVIGTGSAPARGMHQGYVVNREEAAASVLAARRVAESASHVPIRSCFLAIGSVSLEEARATGETIISRADQEITDIDLELTLKKAREAAMPAFLNRTVLHEIPLEHRVDGTRTYGQPVGMKGTRLEVVYLFITCLSQHLEGLVALAEGVDIEVIDQVASPLAESNVILTNDQKMRGCVLANIGAETISTVIYDEGIPLSVKVFPAGSEQITDDLAIAFKISLEDAERVKLGRLSGVMYPRKKIDEVVSARLTRIMQFIEKHLKNAGRRGLLPAGIIFSGGGGGTGIVSDIARSILALPARIGEITPASAGSATSAKFRENAWAVAYGSALWGLTGETEAPRHSSVAKVTASIRKFFHQFLP
ncbi:MAG: hypothetical protein B7X04_03515 [Parcubacteria group bacterium 21-54-25]|nr:MAG: hypothetical protein B7X04_03515 [Parcubacteria group bacterium 21-54-25]HQU08056.1 cell division FtsA domain-containing protein [Candidatus Paceibacterota bacterium]